jgi:hypothetical protein
MDLALSGPALSRAVGFFVLWIMLSGGEPADLVTGAMAALAAHGRASDCCRRA